MKSKTVKEPNNDPEISRGQQRLLDKDYKYRILISMTVQLLRQQNLHKISNIIARHNGINKEKNYFIVCIRLVLLATKQVDDQPHHITSIFDYLKNRTKQLVPKKFPNIAAGQPIFLEIIKNKLESDIDVFERVIMTSLDQKQRAIQLFTGLYTRQQNGQATTRQIEQSTKLAQLAVGVARDKQKFQLSKNILPRNLMIRQRVQQNRLSCTRITCGKNYKNKQKTQSLSFNQLNPPQLPTKRVLDISYSGSDEQDRMSMIKIPKQLTDFTFFEVPQQNNFMQEDYDP